jgi:hypothetical protein
MRQVFDKIKTECTVCGTPLNGVDLLRRGDKFYCPSDFDKTGPAELNENRKIKEDDEFWRRVLGVDENNVTRDYNFADWDLTNVTASGQVWTSSAGGKMSKEILEFGERYRIRVTSTSSAGNSIIYNSLDATHELGTDSFELEFTALSEYIEFRNSAATNTVTFLEIRKI